MAPSGTGSSSATTTAFVAAIIAASAAAAAIYAIHALDNSSSSYPSSPSPSSGPRVSTSASSPAPALGTTTPPGRADGGGEGNDDEEDAIEGGNARDGRVGIVIRGDDRRSSSCASSSHGGGGIRSRGVLSRGTITVVYSSTTGTCERYANMLHDALSKSIIAASSKTSSSFAPGEGEGGETEPIRNRGSRYREACVVRANEIDWFDELTNDYDDGDDDRVEGEPPRDGPPILLFVLPTWTNGTFPPDSSSLLPSLHEIMNDWRVPPEPLRTSDPENRTLRVGAFGMGSSGYDTNTMGRPAKDVYGLFVGKLGARPIISRISGWRNGGGGGKGGNAKRGGEGSKRSLVIGDSESGDSDATFDDWAVGIVDAIFPPTATATTAGGIAGTSPSLHHDVSASRDVVVDDGNVGSECACAAARGGDADDGAVGKSSGGCCSSDGGTKKNDGNDDGTMGVGCCSSTTNAVVTRENAAPATDDGGDDDLSTDSLSEDDDDDDDSAEGGDIVDVEDMGDVMKEQSIASRTKVPLEMVTPKQAKALKKEGYRLIGTHSAVKLCRWTKHQLRGRGGCYKHTHYGITSYQCMEATPSLACANKCVFCWRHHKNPVGKEWRWKTDDPLMIVEEAVREHVSMIKETRGIPGIQMDRWNEAHTVKHCALSLVGEPIMYPRINDLLGELHRRKISTFLVTNGQHPKAIEDLIPITQLYVSVDASTPESLEAIDRPLFRDAWDRLRASLACLKRKGQRTVARLTVVKGWNSDDIGGYARLIALGHCSLVEVKGVTFCGKSDASNLNMTNTPWHHEVVEFSKLLLEEMRAVRAEGGVDPLPEYDLACEHKHSCSVLLARVDQFAVPDPDDLGKRKWRTWIDYDKFQLLAERRVADPTFVFGVEDYVADTPSWAVFGADEEGFDPTDNRHRKKKKHPKYAKFDVDGVPTHDTFNEPLSMDEISRLREQMDRKKMQIGDTTTVTEFYGGEKVIDDASLMFRGLVVTR